MTEMEWTNEKVIDLIKLYHDHPVLWDCRLKEYKDRNKKLDAFLEIANSFGIDKIEIERKIKNLVCHFAREVKKEKESSKSGAGTDDVYKSKWFCYENMLFLKDRNDPKGMMDTITQSQNVDQECQDQVDNNKPKNEETQTPKKRLPKSPPARPGAQKKQKTSATDEALGIIREIQGRNAAMADQYKSFGDQVGMRIRDLPSPHAKKIVKHLISNILFEAEMGRYDNSNPLTGSFSQPLYSTSNYMQPQYSMAPVGPNPNPPFEQPSYSQQVPHPLMSPTPSIHSLADNDSIDNILMEI